MCAGSSWPLTVTVRSTAAWPSVFAARRLPSARRSPTPRRSAMASIARRTDCPSPKARPRPLSSSRPLDFASIAHAMVAPAEIVDLDRALALDHAGVAGVALLEDGLGERRAVDVLGLLERALAVVPRGLPADLVLDGEHPGRPVFAEPHDAGVRLLELLQPLDEAAESLG